MNDTWVENIVVSAPEETRSSIEAALRRPKQLRFGGAPISEAERLVWPSTSQPSMTGFEAIATHLIEQQREGYSLYLSYSSRLQAMRLTEVLLNYQSELRLHILPTALAYGFVWPEAHLLCYTDHELMGRVQLTETQKLKRPSRFSLRKLEELQVGDFVVHLDHGIGRFTGLERSTHQGRIREMIRIVYKDNDLLYISIHSMHHLSKYSSKDGAHPRLSKLGNRDWNTKKQRAKTHLEKTAQELRALYATRKASQGYVSSSDPFSEAAFVSAFPYEDTEDQAKATVDVFQDMSSAYPMDRLICGDVGFGKTEIAIRAAYKCICGGRQVAVLVPTTVLALQHYRSFFERLRSFGVRIDHLHRFRSVGTRKQIIEGTSSGAIDLLIGTSSLVSEQVRFKDLGLLVIDEEQRFGVSLKERLKSRFLRIDVLTLTATPIPRTLQFSLLGVRDVSIIATPPPRRQSIYTTLHRFSRSVIQEAIRMEMERGGQVFFVYNRVKALTQQVELLSELVPEARFGMAHGQMNGAQLERSIYDFVKGRYDVLVCTNIIENGLDIPNANTIIIYHAHHFGLSELHQMRGRVGRSDRKAFCYLITPPREGLSLEATRRLSALEAFTSLGDGYKIAQRDLDIRGAGNLLGAEQSGFMNELGLETYHKLLDETLQELKAKDEQSSEAAPLMIAPLLSVFETDLEAYLPSSYISSPETRMSYYKTIGSANRTELQVCRRELEDRFGVLPEAAEALLESCALRLLATSCSFSKVTLKKSRLRCFFQSQSHPFILPDYLSELLSFISKQSQRCQLSEIDDSGCIQFNEVSSFRESIVWLEQFLAINKKYTQKS